MVYTTLDNSSWHQLWEFMGKTWHREIGCYVGPCLREWQEREEPQPTLYDLYAGYFAKNFSQRATVLRPYHLQGVLIQPVLETFPVVNSPFTIEGTIKQQSWSTHYDLHSAYTVLEKKDFSHPSVDKTVTPFRFVWGNISKTHSLVCQGGNYQKVQFDLKNKLIELFFDLVDTSTIEDRSQPREIEFFVDFAPDVSLMINGHKSNTFNLNQNIILSTGDYQFSLLFELLEGEGEFLGHWMRGNRPSQSDLKGEKRFQAYDWTLFLRTIRRSGPCRIKASFMFTNNENC